MSSSDSSWKEGFDKAQAAVEGKQKAEGTPECQRSSNHMATKCIASYNMFSLKEWGDKNLRDPFLTPGIHVDRVENEKGELEDVVLELGSRRLEVYHVRLESMGFKNVEDYVRPGQGSDAQKSFAHKLLEARPKNVLSAQQASQLIEELKEKDAAAGQGQGSVAYAFYASMHAGQ
jgi:hypothetical protein